MAKTGVRSNYDKFTKKQQKLIADFALAPVLSAGDTLKVVLKIASDTGLQDVSLPKLEEKNTPIKIKGKLIHNPIMPMGIYKKLKEIKDPKKFVNRTGELKKALTACGEFKDLGKAPSKSRDATFTASKKGAVAEFINNTGSALWLSDSPTATKRGIRRRPIVKSAFSKVRGVYKKYLKQRLKLDT